MPPSLNSEPPKRYFALHFILLRFLGLGWWHHPDEYNTTNFPGLYLYYSIITELVWVVGFVSLESIDPFIGEKDMETFMFSLSFVITHDLTIIKLYIFFIKNRDIQDIVSTLEVDLQNFYQNNFKNRRTIRMSRILTGLFIFFGWVIIGNVDVYGICQDIKWKAEMSRLNDSAVKPFRMLPQPIYIPWNYQTDASFTLTLLFETVGLLWTGHIVMTIDTFIGSLILHMSSQFEILQEGIITAYDRTMSQILEGLLQRGDVFLLPDDERDTNTGDYNESIVRRYCTDKDIEEALENTLRDHFKQHQLLISCVEKFANIYSCGFMTQLLSSIAAICGVMVQISKDASSLLSIRFVTSLAFFAAMVFQLAIQCLSSNELTYQADKVAEAVMQCKWERMSPRLRKLLILPMMRAQRPLQLTAAGFANMSNACFLAIMKTAYSYYAVLSQKQV